MISEQFRAAIGGLASIRQWFVWGLQWNTAENKFEKMPVYDRAYPPTADGHARMPGMYRRTGDGHNNPEFWMSLDEAGIAVDMLNVMRGTPHTIGFSLTRDTGYWFLDVDKCFSGRDSNECGATATYLYSTLAGAFYERSSSGTGYHIIGRGHAPEHSTLCKEWGLEFYTDGRGIAFDTTGEAYGNADTDHTAALSVIVPHYFSPRATHDATSAVQMRAGPREDWNGPTDDDDLIRRALQSVSAASAFNPNKATFADLWQGNVARLALAFPEAGKQYGESEADMALIAHLAFWTGCDVDRIDHLMRKSALYRERWEEPRGEDTWLRYSIIRQCAKQRDVLKDKQVEAPTLTPEPDNAMFPVAREVEGETYLNADKQRELFKGCVYVTDAKAVFVPREGGFTMMDSSQFNVRFGGYCFVMDNENGKVKEDAWDAFTKSRMLRHAKVDTTKFRPDLPAGHIGIDNGTSFVNTYVPAIVPLKRGDPAPFLELIQRLLPDEGDRQILIAYMAAVVQHRGVKFKWCPVLQGVQGNGKSTIGDVLMHAVGRQHCYIPKSDDLADKFNDWLYEKVLIVVNDVFSPDGKESFVETLKPMITDSWLQIQGKQAKKVMRDVCANFIMSMNRKDGIRADQNERRFAIFYTAQQSKEDKLRDGLDNAFFNALYDWLENKDGFAICAQWLSEYPIPAHLNPAGWAKVAPDTSTMGEAIIASRGPLEEAVAEAVDAGMPGFRGGWISWYRLKLLAEQNNGHRPKPSTLKQILEKMGYVIHDAMNTAGYTNNPIYGDGNVASKLYVLKNHSSLGCGISNAEAVKLYESAQGVYTNMK